MKPFNRDEYYTTGKDPGILDNFRNDYVKINPKGIYLIADYYKNKYQTSIKFPSVAKLYNLFKKDFNFEGDVDEFVATFFPDIKFANINDFASAIPIFLDEIKSDQADFRVAFYIGSEDPHAIPLIYIKENNEEILLLADSKGANEAVVKTLVETSPIPVYVVQDIRQVDRYSCYADALVLGKDATAKEPNSNNYRVKNLLAKLKSRRELAHVDGKDYYQVKLPDELLKSSQFQKFITFHSEKTGRSINAKNETIEQFHGRFQDKDVPYLLKDGIQVGKGDFNAYIRKKGLEYAHIIEIQFYLEQMQEELSSLNGWDEKFRTEYIKGAKTCLAEKKDLYKFSEDFLNVKKSHIKKI